MSITPNGNVGIGTGTAPIQRTLHVRGSEIHSEGGVAGFVLSKLEAINGVSFERIGSHTLTVRSAQQRDVGVIAQEVEAVFPELVSTHGHENHKAVNYSGLTGVLIEASKELKAQNEALRSRIEALERAQE